MPHYSDGTPARIGDKVRGVPYNNNGQEVVGIVAGLVPNTDACNLRVVFHRLVDPSKSSANHLYCYRHNYGEPPLFFETTFDYGAVKDFALLEPINRNIIVDGEEFLVPRDAFGFQIRNAADVPQGYELYRQGPPGCDDSPIGDAQALAVEEGDKFYAIPPATS